jgi:hypothetical protein
VSIRHSRFVEAAPCAEAAAGSVAFRTQAGGYFGDLAHTGRLPICRAICRAHLPGKGRKQDEGQAMGVLDDPMVVPSLSLLEQTRIQAQVLVPVMHALRAELGRDKADALVKGALRDRSHPVMQGAVMQGAKSCTLRYKFAPR